ncbi:hypothetical protein ACRAWG_09790 [Methylobacterium sp. P31]
MVKLLIAAINEDRRDAENTMFEANPWADPDWTRYDSDYTPARKAAPFTEEEIRLIKANMEIFSREEFTMIAMHCAMSVRPVGLCSIVRDQWVEEDEYDADANLVRSHRIRCVFIETDKDPHYGKRRLPIPECLLAAKWLDGTSLLPDQIVGKLFTTSETKLNLAINNKLKKIGLKSVHQALQGRRFGSCREPRGDQFGSADAQGAAIEHDQRLAKRAAEPAASQTRNTSLTILGRVVVLIRRQHVRGTRRIRVRRCAVTQR